MTNYLDYNKILFTFVKHLNNNNMENAQEQPTESYWGDCRLFVDNQAHNQVYNQVHNQVWDQVDSQVKDNIKKRQTLKNAREMVDTLESTLKLWDKLDTTFMADDKIVEFDNLYHKIGGFLNSIRHKKI